MATFTMVTVTRKRSRQSSALGKQVPLALTLTPFERLRPSPIVGMMSQPPRCGKLPAELELHPLKKTTNADRRLRMPRVRRTVCRSDAGAPPDRRSDCTRFPCGDPDCCNVFMGSAALHLPLESRRASSGWSTQQRPHLIAKLAPRAGSTLARTIRRKAVCQDLSVPVRHRNLLWP